MLTWLGVSLFALAIIAPILSNRLGRRVRRVLARITGWRSLRSCRAELRDLARAEAGDRVQRLPGLIRRVAGVEHVTLFLLDAPHAQFVPMLRPDAGPQLAPIHLDDPLTLVLSTSRGVHEFGNRVDDIVNAAIRAVHGPQIGACRATCAVPLKRSGGLLGFLLCGGSAGRDGVRLDALAALDLVSREAEAFLPRLGVLAPVARRADAAPLNGWQERLRPGQPADSRSSKNGDRAMGPIPMEEAAMALTQGGLNTLD